LKEQWQKDAIIKQMGGLFRASKSRLVANIRAISSREKIINLKPSNIPSLATWLNWVKSKKGEDFKVAYVYIFSLMLCVCIETTKPNLWFSFEENKCPLQGIA